MGEIISLIDADRYLSRKEAACYLGLSTKTFSTFGELPRYILRGKTLYKRSEIDAFMFRFKAHGVSVPSGKTDLASRLQALKAEHGIR